MVGNRLDFFGGRKLAIVTKSEKTLPLSICPIAAKSHISYFSQTTYLTRARVKMDNDYFKMRHFQNDNSY